MRNPFKPMTFGLLTLLLVSFMSINAFARHGVAEDNDALDKTYHLGSWHYGKSAIVHMKSDANEAYFSVTLFEGEKIMIKIGYEDEYNGMQVQLINANGNKISDGEGPVKPNFSQFFFLKADAQTSGQRIYFKILRGSVQGEIYTSVGFEDRMRSNRSTYEFLGKAQKDFGSPYDFNGKFSSELALNLTNEASIPKNAKVTTITTTSSMRPYQGNVKHFLLVDDVWHESMVKSGGSGAYYISQDDNIDVANIWRFKYRTTATGRSEMSRVKLNIDYIFDITDTPEYQ